MEGLSLMLQRRIAAGVERTFAAWTRPEVMTQWWGPQGVTPVGIELDVRVGGQYRIGNVTPDGRTVWITGEYLEVVPPSRLVFTWQVEGTDDESRVTVRLSGDEHATDVVVVHERIGSAEIAEDHEKGWNGCLDGLVELLGA